METVDYPLVGSYNNQRVTSIDAERSVNVFEYIDQLAKKQRMLIQTSGLVNTEVDFTTNTLGFRALFLFNNAMYAIVGDTFYSITQLSNGTLVLGTIGTIGTATGYVGITANTYQVFFVDGQRGYIYDTTPGSLTPFTPITDTSFPQAPTGRPVDCCYLDGFFIVANGANNTFQLSLFNNGLVWGPASNAVTTNNGALPNQLIVGASSIGGSPGTLNFATGVPVTLNIGAGGALPGGLNATDTYYSIYVDPTHIKLATSYANAIAGTAVVFGGDITPIVYLVSLGELQLGSITSDTGTMVACRTLHRRLFLFSQFFTEVWENAGSGTNLPFRRTNSALIEVGTPSAGSIATGFDNMFFLAQDRDGLGSVMQVNGVSALPISNRALDFQLSQYASMVTTPPGQGVADARGVLIKENGLIFYRLNFTAANHTFVYNVTMSDPSTEEGRRWHEEEVLNGDRHPAQVHAYFNGQNYYGSYNHAILYLVDANITTNDGEPIRRMRIGKPICPPGYQRLRIDRFQIDLLQGQVSEGLIFESDNLLTENGLDLLTEDGQDILTSDVLAVNVTQVPEIFFSYSKDGGQTYGTVLTLPMGNVGQRTFRTLIRKLGVTPRGQAFVPKIEYYSKAPFIVLGAAWAFEQLPE